MTTQPKFYVGIANCGCVVAAVTTFADKPSLIILMLEKWAERGFWVEGRETLAGWGCYCGKGGAK